MERALHPEFAKRPGRVDDSAAGELGTLTAAEMIARTAVNALWQWMPGHARS
jgi:hypothetical protein